jgi:hypothetical protein
LRVGSGNRALSARNRRKKIAVDERRKAKIVVNLLT